MNLGVPLQSRVPSLVLVHGRIKKAMHGLWIDTRIHSVVKSRFDFVSCWRPDQSFRRPLFFPSTDGANSYDDAHTLYGLNDREPGVKSHWHKVSSLCSQIAVLMVKE